MYACHQKKIHLPFPSSLTSMKKVVFIFHAVKKKLVTFHWFSGYVSLTYFLFTFI